MSNGGKCSQCVRGCAPGDRKTFNPDCPGCQEKLRLGLRTGLEGRGIFGPPRRRTDETRFAALQARMRAQRQARQEGNA